MRAGHPAEAEVVDVDRRTGIGGGDIAAVIGLTPRWRTPLAVYLAKTGGEPERALSPEMRWGFLHEPTVARAYEEDTGRHLLEVPGLRDRHEPWIIGHPDRVVEGEPILVEMKTTKERNAPAWLDGPPPHVVAQVQWYLPLVGAERADVAVLIGSSDFRIYPVARDEEVIDFLRAEARRFWREHVEARVPPAATAGDAANVGRLFPEPKAPLRRPTDVELALVAALRGKDAEADELEAERGELENRLKQSIGDAEGLEGDTWKIPYRKTKDGVKFDAKAAQEAGAIPPEVLARFTKPTKGARRFCPSWRREGGR